MKVQKLVNKKWIIDLQIFLVNNGFDPEQFDLLAQIDPNISYNENKKNIAYLLNIPLRQMGGKIKASSGKNYNRAAKKEIDAGFCDFLADNCESKCNNGACKAFKKVKCPGEVEPCKPSRWNKAARKKSPGSSGECKVKEYCVSAHTRPPQHNSRTGKEIQVGKYCVTQHPRLCRRSGYG